MQTLGITAKDAALQLEEAGLRLTALKPGSIEYAIELQRLQQMGIDERAALAAGRAAPYTQQNEQLQAQVWGLNRGGSREDVRERLATQTEEYGKASNQVVQQFNRMGLFFETLTQKFALGLFRAIGPDLDKLNNLLIQMQPHFERLMALVIQHAPDMMNFLGGFIKAVGTFADLLGETIQWIEKLPDAVKHGAEAIAGMKLGFELLSSPLGRFLALFTTFMMLLDDYQQWKKNQETGSKVRTGFDWGGFDSILQPLMKLAQGFDKWFESVTGIKHGFEWIIGGIAVAGITRLTGLIKGIGTAANLSKASVAGLTVSILGLVAGYYIAAGVKGTLDEASNWIEDKLFGKKRRDEKEGMQQLGGRQFWHLLGNPFGLGTGPETPQEKAFKESQAQRKTTDTDESKAPVTKTDRDTKGILQRSEDWLENIGKGVEKLIELQPITDLGALETRQVDQSREATAIAAAQGVNLGAPSTPFTGSQKEFYEQTYSDIYEAAKAKGLPHPEIIARTGADQASEESGYGKHVVGNNIFGIKAGGGVGQGSVSAMTHENVGGKDIYEAANFAAFTGHKEAAEGYVEFLMKNKRYAGLLNAGTEEEALGQLGRSGYATNPNYIPNLAAIDNRFRETTNRAPSRAAADAGRQQTVNNSTAITVQVPDPHVAGPRIAAEQERVFDFQVRQADATLQ
jgi:flagellum-specific peptidoglycan hydrolase FlgJ